MNGQRSIKNAVDRVTLFDIRSYLEKCGWNSIAAKNEKWMVFQSKEYGDQTFELILPANDRYTDVQQRIKETISSISQLEDRTIEEVCSDLIATNNDFLLIRLAVSFESESIPIDDASRHVKAIRNLLLYSGCSELQPRPYFETSLATSIELISNFEFCHTFRGSFGFEISNAVVKPKSTPDFF